MRFVEQIQAILVPQDFQIKHYCGGVLAAIEPVGATETICRIYQQREDYLAARGAEQRLARLAIKNYLLAFPVFNTLDVCRSCVYGPVVRPTNKLVRIK